MKRWIVCAMVSFPFIGIPAWAQDPAGRMVAFRGQVEVESPEGSNPARLNQDLFDGDLVRTYEQSRAALLLADETQLKLSENTEMRLQSANRSSTLISRVAAVGDRAEQSLLNLGSGRAYIRSKKTPARVRVDTPAVTAAIRGTEFDILVRPDGETVATVLDGSIDYSNPWGSIVVLSGEQGTARIGEAPTKTVILNPEDAVQWTFFYTTAVSPRDYPFVAASAETATRELSEGVADPLRQAMLLYDSGQAGPALATLSGETSPEAAEVRGWILLGQNQIEEAVAQFGSGRTDSIRVRLGLSLAHLRRNEFDRAFALVEGSEGVPALQLQKAQLLVLAGNVEDALPLLEGIPEDDPTASLAHGLRATIRLTQNRKEEALEAARLAIASAPDSPSARVALSRVLQSFFDLPGATESARRALELDPEFLEAQVQYARLLFGAGLTSRAERILEGADDGDASVSSLVGFILLSRGKTDEADSHFRRAVTLDNSLAEPRLGLGLVHMRRGRELDATVELLAAATLEPRLSLYHSYLAKAYYELREFGQAFTALAAAEELDPRDPTPHLYSAIFLDDLNRPGDAVHSFQRSIELNDQRAVYRSRLLLDQDRATRNVDLARSFNRLGLSEWGNSEAALSVLDDPSNSSARLFLANTFLNLPGRTLVGGSELLLGRLLLPVNANTFNTFNDYTTLFELPRAYWTAEGTAGSYDAFGGTLLATGGTSRLAYSSVFRFGRTDGFRPVNDDAKTYDSANTVKLALSPESSLMFTFSGQQSNEGDHGSPVLVTEFNDPDRRFFLRRYRAEVGYHRSLRPGSDVLVLLSVRRTEQVVDDPERFVTHGGAVVWDLRRSTKEPNLNLQATHLLSAGDFRFRYGLDILEGRTRTWDVITAPAFELSQELDLRRDDVRYRTAFFRSDYHLRPNLILTGGLNWEWGEDSSRANIGDRSSGSWNPQGGVYFSPFGGTRLRLALLRTMQGHFQETIAPVHLYGSPIGRNEQPLTRSTSYSAGWDQRLGASSFLRSTLFWRESEAPVVDQLGNWFKGEAYGGRTTLNRFLTRSWTLAADYSLERARDAFGLRHDHEIDLSMRYIHPRGVFLSVRENFLRQTGRVGFINTATKVFTTDLEAAYELPRKIGFFSFQVRNLFDRRYEFLVDPLALEPRLPARLASVRLRFNF
jgi:tetratricopeptide (TPR) repeat protein